MNTVWSTYIQNSGTLYESRSLRFSDFFEKKYKEIFAIEEKKKILEIGCGPGALAESLKRWYGNAEVTGIDKDSNFIAFAKKRAPQIHFMEGDATELPFEDGSVDVTISNTVAEHIEPSKFFGEQYRVLKETGVCLVLSARNGSNIPAPCILEESDFEKEIWKRTEHFYGEIMEKYGICAYPQNEAELPRHMEKYGFKNVTTEYVTVNLTPDNPVYSKEMAYAMIHANRQGALDGIDSLLHVAGEAVTESEICEMKRLVNERYEKRLALYDRGEKQWDTNLSVIMIVRGVKESEKEEQRWKK